MSRSRTALGEATDDNKRNEGSVGSKSQASLGDLENTHNDKKFK